jgi:hypothetical protein
MLFIQTPIAARTRTVKAMTLLFVFLVFLFVPVAWSWQPDTPDSQGTDASASASQSAQRQPGSISGKVVDLSGVNIVGAVVKLTHEGDSSELEVKSGEDGQFVFSNVAPGDFRLAISFPRLASQEFSGTVLSGQHYVTPVIMLVIPTQVTEIHVGLPPEELETVQVQDQLKQRVFGFVPNFYVSYIPNAAPLTSKHKFELAWKSGSDPVTLIGVGVLAGIDQAGDRWRSYGQGVEGYAKRYGATYANVFAATFIGGAILPSVLKQDPRYFYKGSGSKRSRLLHALAASSVTCKGDNGHWQPNYSNVLGSFAAAGIATAYIPAIDRRNVGSFIVSSALIRIGETSLGGVLQEFVFPKLTHRARSQQTPNQKP